MKKESIGIATGLGTTVAMVVAIVVAVSISDRECPHNHRLGGFSEGYRCVPVAKEDRTKKHRARLDKWAPKTDARLRLEFNKCVAKKERIFKACEPKCGDLTSGAYDSCVNECGLERFGHTMQTCAHLAPRHVPR